MAQYDFRAHRNAPPRGAFRQDMPEEDEDRRQRPRPQTQKGRSNPSTKKFQNKRNEAYRERSKSNEYQKELKDKIREKLHANTEEEDMKILAGINAERAQMLSVSTRGIGLGVMLTATAAKRYHPHIIVPSVHLLYRVSLGILEAKLAHMQTRQPIISKFINIHH